MVNSKVQGSIPLNIQDIRIDVPLDQKSHHVFLVGNTGLMKGCSLHLGGLDIDIYAKFE